jgi:uncharacterized protein YkwD
LSIDHPGAAADLLSVTRSKAFVVALIVLAAVVLGATASAARTETTHVTLLKTLNHQLATAINDFRKAHHLQKLRVRVSLNASARQHSKEMGTDGYFDHSSADGTAFWKRIEHYYTMKHYHYWAVGENLLFASPDISAVDALSEWIASPEHLANLENKNWRDIGISAVHVSNAPGVYGGDDVTIITTDFGVRRK